MPFRRCRKRTPCKEEWLSIEWPVGETEPAKYWLSTLPADTTKRAARYAPKPPSTTPATSPSAGGFTICPRCGRSAFQPTAVFSKYQPSVTICLLAEEAFQKINRPIQVGQQRGAALRFADPCVPALWSALVLFPFLPAGFSNRDLRQHWSQLLGLSIEQVSAGCMSYNLRRLRLHGMIERIPDSHRYRLTPIGLRSALFFTRTYARILRPGLAHVLPAVPAANSSLRRCFHRLEQEVHAWTQQTRLAA